MVEKENRRESFDDRLMAFRFASFLSLLRLKGRALTSVVDSKSDTSN